MPNESTEARIHRALTAAPFPHLHRFVMDRLARVMAEELDRLRREMRGLAIVAERKARVKGPMGY